MTPDHARRIADDALMQLLRDPGQLMAFLEATGLSPDDLRRGAGSDAMGAALLDFLVQDDAALQDCAAALGLPPARLMEARTALAGPGSYGWSVD